MSPGQLLPTLECLCMQNQAHPKLIVQTLSAPITQRFESLSFNTSGLFL